MDFIISIASKIAEYAVAPVGRQLGYLIFYKSNIDNLKIQVQNLEAAKNTLQHSVDAAKSNGEEIEDNVEDWLKKVDDTIADAKKFHDDEGQEKFRCSSRSFPNPWTRHQVSRKANKMAHGIAELAERKFEKISYLPPLPVSINPSARGYLPLESRTSMLNDIMQTLKASNEYVIGLYGMGGVGKTTLIKQLAWKAEQDGSFDTVVLANVTNSPDVKRIQGEIADKLGLQFDKETLAGRASRLRDRIRKEKTILVILDDIWEKLDLSEVGVPFGDDHKGCKLLLTSRDLNVLKSEMGAQKDFKLEVLSKEEGWSLFENMAGDVVKDSNLQPTALEVAEGCAGLPLLMTTMAKGLKNKDLYAWKDALKQLTRFHHKGLPAKVSSAIELSYNNLATAELKSLFLLIGSFGQTVIWTRYLLIYFWGLGLYEQPDTLANARDRLFNLVMDLKSSCLLLEGEGDDVRMHDIVHEVAHKIASRDRPIFAVKMYNELKEWPQMEWLKKCYRIFLPYNRLPELPKSLECPELEILVLVSLNQRREVPDEFFGGMKELKVLYLGGMDCTKSLPSSLYQLTKLRALYLRECLLEDIALVVELKNLEILGLEISNIKELPAVIGQLSRLRLLDLGYCSVSTIAAGVISSLISLEELYTAHTFIRWGVEGQGNKSPSNHATLAELRNLNHLTALDIMIQDPSILPKDLLIFKKLERYVILIGGGWTWSSRYETSRTLKLNEGMTTSIHLDYGVRFLLDNVEDLYLSQLKGVNNVLYQLNGKGFPQLKHLNIQNSMQVQYIIDSKEWRHPLQAFPNLESLILHNLTDMKSICSGPLPIHSFTKLKVIKVKYCNSLENLLLYSVARDLPQLLEVEISKCKTMSEIIVKGDTQIDMIKLPRLLSLTLDYLPMLASFFSKPLTIDIESRSVEYKGDTTNPVVLFDKKISFPNLENLKLSSINSRKIWADELLGESCIQKLTSFTIDACHYIKYLFLSSMAQGLINLQQLNITGCGMLEEIVVMEGKTGSLPSSTEQLSSEVAIFPNLETMEISHMDNMNSVWPDQPSLESFSKLIKMEISFCPKLLKVLPSYVLNYLHNLEMLLVTDCAVLEVIFGTKELNEGVASKLPKLLSLTLESLPMLASFFSKPLKVDTKARDVTEYKDDLTIPIVLFDEKISFPNLENLKLCSINSRMIWADKLSAECCIQNLMSLTIDACHNIKYLFSSSMAQGLINLQQLDITRCGMLEEIVVVEGKTGSLSSSTKHISSEVAIFPNLETLKISHTDNLNSIWPDQLGSKSFSRLIKMEISFCPKLLNIIPSCVLNYLHNLETLLVADCAALEVIFEMKELKERIASQGSLAIHLKTLTLKNLQMLKHIWSNDPRGSFQCQNLCIVVAINCQNLSHLFPLSIAKELLQLQELTIVNCGLENIIAKDEIVEEAPKLVFPQLTTLRFWNLAQLRSFYPGIHTLDCPKIIKVNVDQCFKLEVFKPKSPNLQDKVQVVGQPIFSFEETGSPSKKTGGKENIPFEEDEEETVKPPQKKRKTSTPKDGRGHGHGKKYFKGRTRMKLVNHIPPRSNLGHKNKKNKNDKQSTFSKSDIGSHQTSQQIVKTSNKEKEISDSRPKIIEFPEINLSKEAPAPSQLNVDPNVHDLIANDHACDANKGKTVVELNTPDQNDESDEDPLAELESILSGIHKSSPKSSNSSTLFSEDTTIKEALYNLECSLNNSLESLLINEKLCCKLNIALDCLEEAHNKLPVDVIRLVDGMKSSIGNLFQNFKTTQNVVNDQVERLDKKNKLIQYMGEAKERQEQLSGKMLEGKTEVDCLDKEIARLTDQIQVLVEQKTSTETKKDKLKKVLRKCEGEKKKLKDEAREWVKESREIMSAIENHEATYKDALSKQEKMKEKWESFQKDLFVNIKSSSNS